MSNAIGDPFRKSCFFFDNLIGIAICANSYQMLGGMKLAAQDSQHIHASHGLPLYQNCDIVPIHFQTHRFFERDSVRLVWRLLQHGSEAKELAITWLIDHYFLLVLIDRRNSDAA